MYFMLPCYFRCRKWVQNSRRDDLRKVPVEKLYGYRLCSMHFEDSQFMNVEKKDKLVWSAVPTLFDVPNPPKRITPLRKPRKRSLDEKESTSSEEVQEKKVQKLEDTPRKIKLKRTVNKLRTKLYRKEKALQNKKTYKYEHIISGLRSFGLSENTLAFFEGQIRLCQKKKSGYRYAVKDKMLALSIYYQSRKAYKLLRKIFILPSRSTIQASLQNTNISPGFNNLVFNALQLKVQSMDIKDKNVALVFDEMSLKSALVYNTGLDLIEGFEDLGELGRTMYVADHALVFMVRGLYSKWKQPLAYFLTSGPVKGQTLQTLTKMCIDKLNDIGLEVNVLICDQGTNNRNFLDTLEKVSIEKPYFMHNDKKVFVIYDPPHLIKNVRNNLKKGDLHYDDQTVSWKHIVAFYSKDTTLKIRMAPKLTERHINLPAFSAMKVSLATQVFSHSVAAGINTLANLNFLPPDACVTAEFLETFDQLFNTFNSSSQKSSQKYCMPFNNTGHTAFLKSCLKFLAKIKTESGKTLPCLTGWQISINALFGLWTELAQRGFKYFLTKRVQQDCLENLFSVLRGRGGFRDNPDPQQFRADFRQVVVNKLFVQSSFTNCEVDCDKILLDISSLVIHKKKEKVAQNVQKMPHHEIQVLRMTNPTLCLPEKNVATYMAGYLLRKFQIQNCLECSSRYQQSNLPESSELSTHELIRNKNYKPTDCLIVPTNAFATFAEALETLIVIVFPTCMHSTSVLESLAKNAEEEIAKVDNCGKEVCRLRLRNIAKHFMKVRIFHALKMSNIAKHQSTGNRRNRKLLKLSHL